MALSFLRYLAIERADTRIGHERDGHRTRARARERSTASQRASPGARTRAWLHDVDQSKADGVEALPQEVGLYGHACRSVKRVVGLHDLLHQLVADDVLVVEVDEADPLDVA